MQLSARFLALIHQLRVNGYEVQLNDAGLGPIDLTLFSPFDDVDLKVTFDQAEERDIAERLSTRHLTSQQADRLLSGWPSLV